MVMREISMDLLIWITYMNVKRNLGIKKLHCFMLIDEKNEKGKAIWCTEDNK
jgi:hypothetical protein